MKNDALFFTCALIECIGRETRQTRKQVVSYLGEDIERIYKYADVFHCEPVVKVAWDFIERDAIPAGAYDVKERARYAVPSVWEMGDVFSRIVQDCYEEDRLTEGIRAVFSSPIAEAILNFNSDLYYQPREYLAACYRENWIIAA